MLPLKLFSFALKAYVAIFIHLYKIDILNIGAEKRSSLDSNISSFIVASCVACMLSKIDFSPHLKSISNTFVYLLESVLTIYGTETIMYMIWLPLLRGLSWISSKIGKTFTRSRHKFSTGDPSNCIESDLFCYLNICLALYIASNTLASFDCIKNLKTLWPTKLMPIKNAPADLTTEIINTATITEPNLSDRVNVNPVVRPKRKPILLMNVH